MTFHNRSNRPNASDNDRSGMGGSLGHDDDDKSSLEAAAEAAAKVNAMLIAKGMLKPNQLHSGIHNVVTKKLGGPNSLVVAEVEINYLPLPCRNTLTRGTTQEEISKASGASVTTRGRYMTEDERARNPRDRCLYLNIQASKKESVDVAVQKINEIIKSMGGDKMKASGGPGFHGSGRFHSPSRPNVCNPRFGGKNQTIPQQAPPPPLMSLPTPQLQQPPPYLPQVISQSQIHIPPPPPATVQVTVMQEKLYVGLEHAPPNFDTKNKLLGPGGSYLQHIQSETGSSVSLRGKGSSCFMDLNGADAFEPMHIHIEHSSLIQLQEAKKLAENLIQTVQQSYVSFQQALAALPPSMPTGLITGVPQQPPMVEHQLTVAPSGLATIATAQEQPLQALQPQALANTATGQSVVIPSSMTLQVPMVTSLSGSAPPPIMQQPAPLDLVGQQTMLINHHQAPPPQAVMQQVVPTAQPQPVPPPPGAGAPMATAYAPIQHSVQLVSQAPPSMVQQPAPALLTQPPPQVFPQQHQSIPSLSVSLAPPSSLVYTVASSSGHAYYSSLKNGESSKRRFREEKDDKIPENLLGYQHGPPHLVNLVRSSPPPQPQPVPPPPISQAMATQLIQQPPPPHGMVMSHMPPPGLEHLGGQAGILPPGHLPMGAGHPPMEGQQHQLLAQHQPQAQPGQQGIPPPPHQFVSGPPPQHYLPPPMSSPTGVSSLSPSHMLTSSPNGEMRPHSRNDKCLMPPPPPPSGLGSPVEDENPDESNQSEDVKDTGGKRKSNGYSEPEKKKIKGILKNKQEKPQEEGDERSHSEQNASGDEQENKKHPASPQYQGQPLRYPSMPSDPNVPPQLQEMGIHGPRPHHPSLPPTMIAGHHLVQPSDPNLPPQVHHPPPHQHIHIEGPRPEGPPPAQIVIEHPVPHAPPMSFSHHRPPGPPGTPMHVEQHTMAGGQLPPRPLILEHHPPPPPHHLEHLSQPPIHHESLQHPSQHPGGPQHMPIQTQPPPHQEVVGPPPFQGFESIPVSALSQPDPQAILQTGPAVLAVSSAQHYIPYSMTAISTQTAPPSQASFTSTHTSGQIPMYSQPLQQSQMMTAPPPVPQSSYSLAVPPSSSPHFQAHFSHPSQQVQGQVLPPPPPSMPVASQHQFHQSPQGIHYWAS